MRTAHLLKRWPLAPPQVVDYTAAPLYETLAERFSTDKFDVFIDAVGMDHTLLFTRSESYIKPGGIYVACGNRPSGYFSALGFLWHYKLRPRWLGGTNRRFR